MIEISVHDPIMWQWYMDTKVVNETLLPDVEILIERLELLIPGRAEEIIDELKESNTKEL